MRLKYLLIIMLAGLGACKKQPDQPAYKSQGQIIGYDMRMCSTCGGYEVTFTNADPSPQTFFLVSNPDALTGINAQTIFPINISADWTFTNTATNRLVTITRFKIN
jgi:uncharacterized protein involved in high-affinity Fe2+ transport